MRHGILRICFLVSTLVITTCVFTSCGLGDPKTPQELAARLEAMRFEVPPGECHEAYSNCAHGMKLDVCCDTYRCFFRLSDGTQFFSSSLASETCLENSLENINENVSMQSTSQNNAQTNAQSSNTQNSQNTTNSGSGIKTCVGRSKACDQLFSPYSCQAASGCEWRDYGCSGLARSCVAFYSPGECNRQLGCYYDYYRNQCQGAAYACSSLSTSSCTLQRGCYSDDPVCVGTAHNLCSGASESVCKTTSGCSWQ